MFCVGTLYRGSSQFEFYHTIMPCVAHIVQRESQRLCDSGFVHALDKCVKIVGLDRKHVQIK